MRARLEWIVWLLACSVLFVRVAAAAPVASEATPPPPDRAHGFRVPPAQTAGGVLLWVPRGVLFVPAGVIEGATHPVRVGLTVYEKYAVPERLQDIFFNDARTFGAYPTALFETGFGLNVGGRLVHRNLGGHRERLFVRAGFGGLYRQRYEASLDSGNLLGNRFKLQATGGFRIVPRARFYGIGDAGEHDFDPARAPVDPFGSGIETRYRRDEGTAAVAARIVLHDRVRVAMRQEIAWRRFSDPASGGPALEEAYDTTLVTGYDEGQLRAYSEAAVVVDTLSWVGPHIPRATPSSGWLARGSTGIGLGFDGDPSRWVRGGLDVQRFIDLYRGNRVLRLRGLIDVIDAPYGHIVFVDLPALGGPSLLRGYVRERFRGRIAALGSVEYTWPIDRLLGGFLFCDLGRVWDTLPLELNRPRVGFGGGVLVRSRRRFFARLQLAGSIDGDFFMQLRFDPTWDTEGDL